MIYRLVRKLIHLFFFKRNKLPFLLDQLQKDFGYKDFSIASYSQEGEDVLFQRIYDISKKGFYIDVGAHHPFRFSNTQLLYQNGWRGINIDPIPGAMEIFNKYRPEDINLNTAIGENGKSFYYRFEEAALNTFDEALYNRNLSNGWKFLEKIEIDCIPLKNIVDSYLPKDKNITLLSIDVEGLELEVLNTIDWKYTKPEFIFVEFHTDDIISAINHPVYKKLTDLGYFYQSKLKNTHLFQL